MVTHDRYFMDRLVDHVFVLDGSHEVKDIHGNYTDYRDKLAAAASIEKRKPVVKNEPVKIDSSPKKKLSYKEQKELDDVEKLLASLELKKNNLLEKMNKGSDDHVEITKWSAEYSSLEKALEEQMLKWMEIQERFS